jgi:MoaA/NifB/PqqE/SkfB family radical SAM enzyme
MIVVWRVTQKCNLSCPFAELPPCEDCHCTQVCDKFALSDL